MGGQSDRPCIKTMPGGTMTGAKKSYRLELTKEQQAIVLQKTGVEAKELEVTADELKTQAEPKGG
jgi:hypothetical protein